jgi:hypothetical protein
MVVVKVKVVGVTWKPRREIETRPLWGYPPHSYSRDHGKDGSSLALFVPMVQWCWWSTTTTTLSPRATKQLVERAGCAEWAR